MRHYWWERLETVPSEAKTVHDFMVEKNFLWKVVSLPCFTLIDGKYVKIDRHKVCARSDDMKPMYVVKKQYHLLNNEECFQIMDEFKKKYEESKFVSCGDILNQKKSYLTMSLKHIEICGDDFSVYLTITNGFDGRNAVNCTLSLIRNKDHSVLQICDDECKRIWTMGRVNSKFDIDHYFNEIEIYLKSVQSLCNELNEVEISLNDFIKPMFDLDWKKSKCVNLHVAEEKEYIREIYLKNNGKTLYDLYMAISCYFCNHKMLRNGKLGDDLRFDSAMCGCFYELHDYEKYIIEHRLN